MDLPLNNYYQLKEDLALLAAIIINHPELLRFLIHFLKHNQ